MYRNKMFCFNDDIQGTGAVIVSGFMNAVKLSGVEMKKHKIVFLGAGSASIGVASEIS
jgi:malate dehydrogenase (oxaloacetate-decarboxylating)(NADP+)